MVYSFLIDYLAFSYHARIGRAQCRNHMDDKVKVSLAGEKQCSPKLNTNCYHACKYVTGMSYPEALLKVDHPHIKKATMPRFLMFVLPQPAVTIVRIDRLVSIYHSVCDPRGVPTRAAHKHPIAAGTDLASHEQVHTFLFAV